MLQNKYIHVRTISFTYDCPKVLLTPYVTEEKFTSLHHYKRKKKDEEDTHHE